MEPPTDLSIYRAYKFIILLYMLRIQNKIEIINLQRYGYVYTFSEQENCSVIFDHYFIVRKNKKNFYILLQYNIVMLEDENELPILYYWREHNTYNTISV